MKNKLIKITLLTLTLIFIISALASCGDTNEENGGEGHEHTFVWHHESTGHLKELTCGCAYVKAITPHSDTDENGYCDDCNFNLNTIIELSDMFKTAYANSFEGKSDMDFDKIYIRDYFGKIGDAHVVSIYSDYLPYPSGKGYPDGAYNQSVEGMEFRYDNYYVYIIHNGKLYSAKSAYENSIIDFNGLCKLFGLHTSKKHTFNEEIYNTLQSAMKLHEPEWSYYELQKYYGEYNGYYAVSYNFRGMQVAAGFTDQVGKLRFEYGYKTSRIRLMNDTEMYTLGEAKDKGIITDEDLYELFAIHTKSEAVNEDLVEFLLTPAYELCLKYKDGFDKEVDFDNFYLERYYGKYGECHIFALTTTHRIRPSLISISEEDLDIIQYGFYHSAYVLYEGRIYTMDRAVQEGLITEEIKKEINNKYYYIG